METRQSAAAPVLVTRIEEGTKGFNADAVLIIYTVARPLRDSPEPRVAAARRAAHIHYRRRSPTRTHPSLRRQRPRLPHGQAFITAPEWLRPRRRRTRETAVWCCGRSRDGRRALEVAKECVSKAGR
jgi:hypothetical protein